MARPLCFVLMPFGKKPRGDGGVVDFDAVYRDLIAPAIEAAGLAPLRADEEQTGGVIHRPMFERLILCEYAVADLTTANANVFYELGLRHATREWSTVLIFAAGAGQLPFDVAPLRGQPYALGPDGKPSDVAKDREALAGRLREAVKGAADSPVYQLVDGYPDVQHRKTDVFRDQVQYSEEMKRRLAEARSRKPGALDALRAIEAELSDLSRAEAGVVIDLFLSYRAVEAFDRMIELVPRMSPPLAATVMVQEQLGLALNRAGRGEEAERTLLELIERRGPSSETYGILGRVHKDRWEAARNAGSLVLARGLLDKAIDAYLRGFETDWRDAYPGVNAVTLMECKQPRDPRQADLVPVVAYAVGRRFATGKPDYWDHATALELAVLTRDEEGAQKALSNALASVREGWEPKTTLRNLRLIQGARTERKEEIPWAEEIDRELAGAVTA